jgi:hypothetical protein
MNPVRKNRAINFFIFYLFVYVIFNVQKAGAGVAKRKNPPPRRDRFTSFTGLATPPTYGR